MRAALTQERIDGLFQKKYSFDTIAKEITQKDPPGTLRVKLLTPATGAILIASYRLLTALLMPSLRRKESLPPDEKK